MFKLLRHIITFFTIFAFLFTTMGFKIYHHHCNQTGLSQYAYSESDIHCKHHHDKVNNKHTHSIEKTYKKEKNDAVNDEDCCSTSLILLKTNKILLSNSLSVFIQNFDITIFDLPSLRFEKLIDNNKTFIFTDSSPPPLLHGKQLNIFFSRLKIDL